MLNNKRFEYIDALRGLAIAGVLLVHCGQQIENMPLWLDSATRYGGRGVQLFFMLSALTLMTVYHDRKTSFKHFIIRRFFRIAPMFYAGIVFYSLWNGDSQNYFSPEGIGLKQIVLTLFFVHPFSIDSFNAVVPGGWSIGNEMMFYVLFLPLLHVSHTLKRSLIIFLASVVISRLNFVLLNKIYPDSNLINEFATFHFATQFVAFAAGIVIFHLFRHITNVKDVYARAGFYLSLLVIVLFAVSGLAFLRNYLLVIVLFVPLIVSVALCQPKALVNRFMMRLGKISYSVYIVHFAVIHFVKTPTLSLLGGYSTVASLCGLFVVVLIASMLVSEITYKTIEMKGIALGKRFT